MVAGAALRSFCSASRRVEMTHGRVAVGGRFSESLERAQGRRRRRERQPRSRTTSCWQIRGGREWIASRIARNSADFAGMPGFRVWRDEIEDRVANTGRVVASVRAQNGCIHRPSYTRPSVKGETTLAPSAEDRRSWRLGRISRVIGMEYVFFLDRCVPAIPNRFTPSERVYSQPSD